MTPASPPGTRDASTVFLQKCMRPTREGSQVTMRQAQGAASAPPDPGRQQTAVPRGSAAQLTSTGPTTVGTELLPRPLAPQPLAPQLPPEGELRGPQPGWPGTLFSLLACSAVHSGNPAVLGAPAAAGGDRGHLGGGTGKKCRGTPCWELGLPEHCPPWLPGKRGRPLPWGCIHLLEAPASTRPSRPCGASWGLQVGDGAREARTLGETLP